METYGDLDCSTLGYCPDASLSLEKPDWDWPLHLGGDDLAYPDWP
jgi:hypothetical protein